MFAEWLIQADKGKRLDASQPSTSRKPSQSRECKYWRPFRDASVLGLIQWINPAIMIISSYASALPAVAIGIEPLGDSTSRGHIRRAVMDGILEA